MAKALMGSHSIQTMQLLNEVRSLRQRVAELEAALEQAEATAEQVEETERERVLELERASQPA